MNWWLLGALYWLGFTQVGRLLFMWAEEAREAANEKRCQEYYRRMLDRSDIPQFWGAVFGSMFWPIAVFVWLTIKLMFPRGLTTKAKRHRLRETAEKERQQRVIRMETAAKRLLEIDQRRQLLAITAVPEGELAFQAAQLESTQVAKAYEEAEREFAEACAIVQANAGKPWSIGHLANVRIRKPRAKATV
jgi:hypothetical protein